MEFPIKDVEEATRDFALDRLIGKGSHGCVYKGILKGGKTVAVKKTSLGLRLLGDNSKLDNEMEILSSIQSPHIVNLLGVSCDSNGRVLVMEFMANGSLESHLHNASRPPSWFRRAVLALQIAEAILELHQSNPPVIHRDIKSANILLDLEWNARLADFGLAVRVHSNSFVDPNATEGLINPNSGIPILSRTIPAGTIGYLDPCYTTPGSLSTKNDVFSFGVVLLEIVSCRRAMDIAYEPVSIVEWALPSIQDGRIQEVCDSRVALPHFMKGAIRQMLCIAAKCVSSNKENRPSMVDIVSKLKTVVDRSQFSFWGLLSCSFLRRMYPYTKLKRKQTARRISCKADEAEPMVQTPDSRLQTLVQLIQLDPDLGR